MASISDEQKKRVGRPATGISPQIGVRFSADTLAAIDAEAAKLRVSRSTVVRAGMKTWLRGRGYAAIDDEAIELD